MSRLKRLIVEAHQRSLWQALLVYFGASFALVEVLDVFIERFGLPSWLFAVAVTLLLIGLPVVIVTSLAKEEVYGDEVPEEHAQAAAEEDRRLRFLTWRTAGLSFLVALALWGVVAAGLLLFGGYARPPGAERPSVAVLPLVNRSGLEEDVYFTDGIHDEILTQLSKIGGLSVRGRTSVMEYRYSPKNLRQIGEELNARYLMEGGVQRAGETVRINVQLIDSDTDEHVFVDTYDRELSLENLLAVQREVALRIADALEATLTPQEREQIEKAPTDNLQAYDDYLIGLYKFNKTNMEGWKAAIDDFQRSIDKDPSFALAYAMMAAAYNHLGYYSLAPPSALRSRALEAAERAVALDNSLADAHAILAMAKMAFDWDWAAADQASQEGLRLNPNSTRALSARAFFLGYIGQHEESIELWKRFVELEPVAPHVNTRLGVGYLMAQRYDESISQLNKAVALEPDYLDAHIFLCYAYAKKGMHEEAARESVIVTGYRQSWWPEAWVLAVAGQSAQARELISQIPAEESEIPAISWYYLAAVLGELGEKDRAFDALERAYRGRTPAMTMLKIDGRLDSLRDDPRFEDLLRRMDFPS
jgi:TolB-like protein